NARDAMPQGGKLLLETANVELEPGHPATLAGVRPGPYVRLAVSDTGRGMTPEVKARIFEPFFTTKGVGQGTGLGLAMVHGFIKQSEGHVEVYSEPGLGTTFNIYLPRVGPAAQPAKSHAGLGTAPRGSETVLLVEDDDGVRALSRFVLQGSGYAVLEAGHGSEALRVAEQHRGAIHLLVTDVVMPGLGGRELAERLTALCPGLRVLFLIGYTEDAVVRRGILREEVHFLQKPFSPLVLAHKVREVLDAPAGAGAGGPGGEGGRE